MNKYNISDNYKEKKKDGFIKHFTKSFFILLILLLMFGIGVFFGYQLHSKIF